MFTEIHSYEQFIQLKESEPALLAYFSTDACNVCKVLKPKVGELLHYDFPKIKAVYVKTDVVPDVAAQHQIFTVPTILVFFDGRETIRKSRNIGIDELRKEIQRLYSIIFSE